MDQTLLYVCMCCDLEARAGIIKILSKTHLKRPTDIYGNYER